MGKLDFLNYYPFKNLVYFLEVKTCIFKLVFFLKTKYGDVTAIVVT